MISSEIVDYDRPVVKQYPYLGLHQIDEHKTVVLFHRPLTGVVVFNSDPKDRDRVGHYSENWVEEKFVFYNDKVVLVNE